MRLSTTGNIAQDIAENLVKIETVMSKELGELANRSMLSVKATIKNGKGTNFETMVTKSPKAKGRYSERYGEKRGISNKQTEKVDLNFKGDLIADFEVINKTKLSATVGFKTEEQAQLMEWHEEYYGFMIADVGEDVIEKEVDKFFERVNNSLQL